jgi:hypothetical protein
MRAMTTFDNREFLEGSTGTIESVAFQAVTKSCACDSHLLQTQYESELYVPPL